MMLDGDTRYHLKIIEHLLLMQGAKNTNNRMEIRFLLGSPPEVFVYVDDLKDIDLADVYGMTGFKTMHVYNANKKKWTLKAVRELIRAVKADFRYDWYEPEIDFKYKRHLLEINCRME